jgi:hydrogenase maturation protein HypF
MLPVRRSRGYAPLPVALPLRSLPALAVGGELKTTACLAAGHRAVMSQHVGDTGNLETLALLDRTVDVLMSLTRIRPELVVADAHPAYLSQQWAADRAGSLGAPLVLVQHHHAHLGSLLAEHGVAPGEEVLGFVFDGTGFGSDGTIWGGEVLLGSYRAVERVGHLVPVALPGGDAAIRRPARSALAHLRAAGIEWDPLLPPVAAADATERQVVARMLDTGTSCTPTTSMGRLFDAVASLLGVCQDADYEGQAAIELEALAATVPPRPGAGPDWRLDVRSAGGGLLIDPAPALAAGVASVRSGVPAALAARYFHEALADAVAEVACRVRVEHGVTTVGLTGGVFQNALLSGGCHGRLAAEGFTVLTHRVVPPNDGGLALGQIAIAAGSGVGS